MKELVKTSRTAGFLEKVFRQVNNDLFGGEVEEPIITIQNTPSAYGHCSVYKIWNTKNGERHELNIDAGSLDRPIENTIATLIHEMTHLLNLQRGIQDCSRGGSYHNKKFKEEAEKHLIKIDYDARIGWSITSPTEELIDYIITKGFEEIQMDRASFGASIGKPGSGSSIGTQTGTGTKKPSSTRKYQCPKCGMSVRATKEVHVKCMDCDAELIQVS